MQSGGYFTAVVWYAENDQRKSLRAMAERGYPGGLAALRALPTTWADTPRGQGAAASAIRSGQSQMVEHLRTDAGYTVWRDHLPSDGSSIACPLRIHGQVIGALAIYDAQPGTFSADEMPLLEECANDLAFGIEGLRARVEQVRIQTDVHRLTHQDALTGLPNEAQFTSNLVEAMAKNTAANSGFFLVQIDIERLRAINNALGFSQGDRVLQEFAKRLLNAVPTDAKVARLRADEFAVLLPGRDRHIADSFAAHIERVFAQPFAIDDLSLDLSVKAGLVLYPDHGATPHDLYRRVDLTVNHAKRRGVGYAFFDPSCDPDRRQQLGLAASFDEPSNMAS